MYYRTSQVLKAQQTIYFGNEISLLRIACMFVVLTMHTSSKLNTTNFDCEFTVIFVMYTAAHRRPSATKKTKPEILGLCKSWREKGPEFCFWATN